MISQLEIERSISAKMEHAIRQMLAGDIQAYHLMRDALKFAEEQRKGVQDVRGIQNLHGLEHGRGSS